jgi:transcription elongation factor GreB
MSKAFTKEDSDAGEDDERPEGPGLPQGFKNYMTPAGAARLRDELQRLLHTERPEVVRTVSWAASNGDRSENGDYIYGKKRLREIDRRVRFLTRRLDSAEVVDPARQSGETVLFGARVRVADEEGRERWFAIVGVDEADAARGRISWISPMAKALLGHRVGETVALRTPQGESELEILELRYEALSTEG